MSPTQLTLRELRRQGYTAQVTERWNPHAGVRQDLFGVVDVLGVAPGETIGVQACAYKDVSKRADKIAAAEKIGAVREAGWTIQVWGWRKVKGRWRLAVLDVS